MILDSQAWFENNVALTATRVSTDKYDLGVALRDPGQFGDDLWIVGIVGTALTSGGSSTLTVDLIDDDNAALSSPATVVNLMPSTAKATLVAGYVMFMTRFPLNKLTQRYVGLQWTVGTADFTGGTVKSYLVNNVDAQRYFAKGYVNY